MCTKHYFIHLNLPRLELLSRPLKSVIQVTKARETRKEHIKFGIGCCHDNNVRLHHPKYGEWYPLQHWRIKMLNAGRTRARTLTECKKCHNTTT